MPWMMIHGINVEPLARVGRGATQRSESQSLHCRARPCHAPIRQRHCTAVGAQRDLSRQSRVPQFGPKD